MVTPTTCLAMIVRNEADTIVETLEHWRPTFDSWCIVDTGSTDGTPTLMRRTLRDVPGVLHSQSWSNFGENRTALLQLARGHADYLLLLDAGWTLDVDYDAIFTRRETGEPFADRRDARFVRDGVEWWRPLLVRADMPWRYVGVTHEYLTCNVPYTDERIDGVTVHPGEPNTARFPRDRGLLLDALADNPDDARAAFYLAQTLRDMGDDGAAWLQYRKRALMSTDAVEETYCAWLECGRAQRRMGNWTWATESFARACDTRPQRLEALHDLIDTYRCNDLHRLAWALAQQNYLPPIPPDDLFVEPWVYRWGLLFQWSICAYWVGQYEDSIDACHSLLERDIPEHVAVQTLHNLGFAERAQRRRDA